MVPPLILILGLASGTHIEHEQLGDSSNATRTFCIYLRGVTAESLLQPKVNYRYHNDSSQLLLHQHADDAEAFSAAATFEGEGTVEYIITAGTQFWTPPNASFASFRKLPAVAAASVAEHTLEDTPHTHYYSYSGTAYFAVVFAIFGAGIFLAAIFFAFDG